MKLSAVKQALQSRRNHCPKLCGIQCFKIGKKREICQLGSITKKDFHVTLFAVVKFFNPPKQSKGHHKYSHFGLVDQTLYENDASLKCICFQTHEEDMPLITNEGDVIKFPARISTYQGKLQARTPDGQFPW